MFVFFTIADLSRYIGIETLLISIPESLGLLAFGVSLVAAAVIGRWLLTRIEDEC